MIRNLILNPSGPRLAIGYAMATGVGQTTQSGTIIAILLLYPEQHGYEAKEYGFSDSNK
jgi:hypothetical protein